MLAEVDGRSVTTNTQMPTIANKIHLFENMTAAFILCERKD